MKKLSLILALLMLTASMTPAWASDEDDVKTAAHAMFLALSNLDADRWIQAHATGITSFDAVGVILNDGGMDADAIRKSFADTKQSGAVNTYQLHHLQATVKGNMAFTTGYLVGNPVPSGGAASSFTWRSTMIWVKEGGMWKRLHYHSSPVILPAP